MIGHVLLLRYFLACAATPGDRRRPAADRRSTTAARPTSFRHLIARVVRVIGRPPAAIAAQTTVNRTNSATVTVRAASDTGAGMSGRPALRQTPTRLTTL